MFTAFYHSKCRDDVAICGLNCFSRLCRQRKESSMFSFFGHRNKDSSKKSSSEGDTDGFVIIGEKHTKLHLAEFVRVRNVNLL